MTEIYGNRTAEEILDEMLTAARDDVDKREGSIVFDMLAPPSEEFEMLGYELDAIFALGYVDTSEGDELKRRTSEMGVDWKAPIEAVGAVTISGADGTVIPVGYTVFTDGAEPVYFEVTTAATITGGFATATVRALVGGIAGNITIGEITQFTATVAGITSVTNNAIFTGGIDGETDDELRARYLHKVRKPITSGNAYHYELWATEIEGVAAAKIFPIWNGNGTVKVVVISSDGRAPDQTVLDAVTAYIEEQRPIGATVTVIAINEVALDIDVTLALEGDLLPADVLSAITSSIGAYLLSEAESGIIRYHRVGEAILAVDGVTDYESLAVNGGTSNITIDAESVAIVGEVTLV
ncbi:baseplate J/gp47 family protein [Sporosarcina psychrophila]|uniref:Phage protein gp47/JayE n=1 Tax=Sporosarcina psychrophila TaxID=1476 RepID=A0ABV2KBU5_SPOPS